MTEAKPRTLFDKIWESHVVERFGEAPASSISIAIFLDELNSPQAFEGLRLAGRSRRHAPQGRGVRRRRR